MRKAVMETEIKELREKILKGLSLAFERLVERKRKNDGDLVLWQDGGIVVVKARDIPSKLS
jgi:urease accessory protein UreE